ncbi:MAG: ATP-binding protein [Vicingaceae bacterium]|nr:ATP-binding protein [Vicingaceae bacterium]
MELKTDIYKILFDNAGQGMLVTNNKGVIELVNPMLLDMFGYTYESELLGQTIEVLIPDRIKDRHKHHRAGYVESPKARNMGIGMDLLAKRKDGSEFSVEIGLNHCCEGEDMKVVAIITDITERVQSQNELKQLNVELEKKVDTRTQELEKSQKLYNLIARNFPRGIINVFDKELNYIFTEGQELDRLGLNSEGLMGKKYTERFDSNLSETITQKMAAVFRGEGISFEFEYDDDFYVVNAVPLKSPEGEVEQILVIEKNITDSKLAEKEMIKNLEKERELNELKTRFVSMASHEFRTPLSTILSSATLAQKYQTIDEQDKRERHLGRIKSSVKNLTSILNDFLSIDKLEEGKVEVNLSEFLIAELIEEAVEEMELYLKKGQTINLFNNLNTEQLVNTDRNVIKNIIINLISNASKYSAEQKNIDVTLSSNNDAAIITIKDYGIGIPKEEQKQLFNRFFRAGNVTNIEGTGLGLNIVKKYLTLVNGDISFISEQHKGTTFTVEIPNILL